MTQVLTANLSRGKAVDLCAALHGAMAAPSYGASHEIDWVMGCVNGYYTAPDGLGSASSTLRLPNPSDTVAQGAAWNIGWVKGLSLAWSSGMNEPPSTAAMGCSAIFGQKPPLPTAQKGKWVAGCVAGYTMGYHSSS